MLDEHLTPMQQIRQRLIGRSGNDEDASKVGPATITQEEGTFITGGVEELKEEAIYFESNEGNDPEGTVETVSEETTMEALRAIQEHERRDLEQARAERRLRIRSEFTHVCEEILGLVPWEEEMQTLALLGYNEVPTLVSLRSGDLVDDAGEPFSWANGAFYYKIEVLHHWYASIASMSASERHEAIMNLTYKDFSIYMATVFERVPEPRPRLPNEAEPVPAAGLVSNQAELQ
jgi:hypothetical protein